MSTDLEAVDSQLADISQIMKSNIDKIVLRSGNLIELQASCEALEAQAVQFQKTSKRIKCKMYLRKIKYQLVIAIIVISLFLILAGLLLFYFLVIKH